MAAINPVFALTATAPLAFALADLRLVTDPAGAICPA
jgi:beta-glucosidase